MVDLKAFVQTVLSDIVCGVSGAQQEGSGPESVNINPLLKNKPIDGLNYAERFIEGKTVFSIVKEIEFDIAITTTEEKNMGAGGGVKVGIFNANINGAGQEAKTHINKIKFSIPIIFPSVVLTPTIKRSDGTSITVVNGDPFRDPV